MPRKNARPAAKKRAARMKSKMTSKRETRREAIIAHHRFIDSQQWKLAASLAGLLTRGQPRKEPK